MIEKPKRVTTSIKIDPNVWKEAKIQAVSNDMDLSELVENAIKKELKSHKLKGGKL